MPSTHVLVSYEGKLYRIAKAPFETEDRAMQRAWLIAKRQPTTEKEMRESICASHMLVNQQQGMVYAK